MYWYSSQVLFLPQNCSQVYGGNRLPQDGVCDFLWVLDYLCEAYGGCHYVHEAKVNHVDATAYADDPAL